MPLGLKDCTLGGRLQRGTDAREHLVEGCEVAHLLGADALGDLLDHAEHRALTDRAVLALEHVVVGQRSEEHTSELQSLMRISYAVFCLKKKKTYNTTTTRKLRQRTQFT